MTCPHCGGETTLRGACPACGALASPPSEGALAPDLGSRDEALRELPAFRRRERTWKDEVGDRVRQRRERRGQPAVANDLPLFTDREAEVRRPAERPRVPTFRAPASPMPEPMVRTVAPPQPEMEDDIEADEPSFEASPAAERELVDLPLQQLGSAPVPALEETPDRDGTIPREALARRERTTQRERPPERDARAPRPAAPVVPLEEPHPAGRPAGRRPGASAPPEWEEEPLAERELEDDLSFDLSAPATASAPPVERPAAPAERLRAAALDGALLGTVALVVVYFASRAARVPLDGLMSAWPWLAGYLSFLGLVYAGYFSGTTGQTLGKMALGLRVVDVVGAPPGFLRASLRALVGAAGTLLLGVGQIPVLLDPARRAFHDRITRTRVIIR